MSSAFIAGMSDATAGDKLGLSAVFLLCDDVSGQTDLVVSSQKPREPRDLLAFGVVSCRRGVEETGRERP